MSRTTARLLLVSILICVPGCGDTRITPPAKARIPVTPTAASQQPHPTPFKGNPGPMMPGSRLWTLADQSAQFRAIVLWQHGDKVRFRKWNDLTVTLTLDQLSQADRDWLAAHPETKQ